MNDIDEKGDYIFHFKLQPVRDVEDQALAEFYRATLQDLLQIIRFYDNGKPMLVTEFSFVNSPETRIRILPKEIDP